MVVQLLLDQQHQNLQIVEIFLELVEPEITQSVSGSMLVNFPVPIIMVAMEDSYIFLIRDILTQLMPSKLTYQKQEK
jgi:hypothetical protein